MCTGLKPYSVTNYLVDGQVLFRDCVILNTNNFYLVRGVIR